MVQLQVDVVGIYLAKNIFDPLTAELRLELDVNVEDQDGNSVTDLDKSDFRLFYVGESPEQITIDEVTPRSTQDDSLLGVYHLVCNWVTYNLGQLPFVVTVQKPSEKEGGGNSEGRFGESDDSVSLLNVGVGLGSAFY